MAKVHSPMMRRFATNTVTVNGQPAWRKGEYFQATVKTNNTTAAHWLGVTVASGGTTNKGNLFVPKTPEQFSYDADGNLTNDGRWSYMWDAENRLIQMTVNTNVGPQYQLNFAYDPRNRRIQKTVSTNGVGVYTNRFLYDGWNLVAELKPNNTLIRSYVWGSDLSGSLQGAGGVGGLLAVRVGPALPCGPLTNTTHFAAYDGNGNVMAYINAADGTSVAQLEYDPFLGIIRATGPLANVLPHLGSTKYYDWETGLYYYGHRYYGPNWGGWPNRDPLGELGFQALLGQHSLLELTKELNRYAFVRNNPIQKVDLYGLAEGFFVVSPWRIPIYEPDARKRGLTPGTLVDGFSVRYVPDKNRCGCPQKSIAIVQVIQYKQNYIPGWSDPVFDEGGKGNPAGNLPPAYADSGGSHNGNLQIFDAPWSGWLFGATFSIEDCAVCRDGKNNPEKVLGCVTFTWESNTHNLNPSGPFMAQDPGSLWNTAMNNWNK